MGSGIKTKAEYFLCNLCGYQIPKAELNFVNGTIQLTLTCNCTQSSKLISLDDYVHCDIKAKREFNCTYPICDSKETPKKELQYCVNCQYWICSPCLKVHHMEGDNELHVLTDYKLLLSCSIHPNSKLTYLWKDKCIFLCLQCQSKAGDAHDFNERLSIAMLSLQKNFKAFQEILKRNLNAMKQVDTLLSKVKNKELGDIAKDTYMISKAHNDNLIKFIQRILLTYQAFKQFPNRNLLLIRDKLKVNETQMKEKLTLDNYHETYQKYCLYLRTNFIVILHEPNQSDIKQSSLIESEALNEYEGNNQLDQGRNSMKSNHYPSQVNHQAEDDYHLMH